jgi:hypothetical protein
MITGRARIAYELGRSERTVSRWKRRGILSIVKDGPFQNNLMQASRSDLERLKASFARTDEAV